VIAEGVGGALHAAVTDGRFPVLAGIALLCGIVRGFSGFGAGMVFMPAASALYAPRTAVIALWIMDSLPGLAIVIPALRHVVWRTVLPVCAGYAVFVHVGVMLLKAADAPALRWFLSVTIFVFVAILWSQWRYRGPRRFWLSAGVGGIAGVFGGAAQIPIPPILTYWMASDTPPVVIRANLIAFLFISVILSGFAFLSADLFAAPAVATGVAIAPAFLAGLLIGARFFRSATESGYRRVAFAIILASAIAGLPLFDSIRS
jgi:uncharacterized membrane protein YfcA